VCKKEKMTSTTGKDMMAGSISGARVRSGHRASLFGILGRKMIPIHSSGTGFMMRGHFPFRQVLQKIVAHSKISVDPPTDLIFRKWASQISKDSKVKPSIQIAETGDLLTRREYMALIGGANHEGWHHLYTAQGPVTGEELSQSILPGYRVGVPYHLYPDLLSASQNVFEDIHIERIGCAEFPGAYTKMADLADFILDQESKALKSNPETKESAAGTALCLIREVGFGYNTVKTRAAMDHYRSTHPEIVDLVLNGALSPVLREAIPDVSTPAAILQAKENKGLSTTLALRFIALLHELVVAPPTPPEPENQGETQQNDPEQDPEQDDLKDPESSNGDPVDLSKEERPGGTSPDGSGEAAAAILQSIPDGVLDYASALEQAVSNALKAEDKTQEAGEMPYRPYTTTQDQTLKPTENEPEARLLIKKVIAGTKRETSFLRSKLRLMFRALEDGARFHGVRKGTGLSERFLVDTLASIQDGKDPSRAFYEDSTSMDTSIAVCIVVDESSSMSRKLKDTSAILYTLCQSLDSIEANFSVVGFRDRDIGYVQGAKTNVVYHRHGPITYDIFKSFEEKFRSVSWRLGNIKATGGTPMADGIEFALNALSTRREGHRILFVVTDGQPNPNHRPIIKGQIRRAQAAGILVIGVGLGKDARYVQTTFPDNVWAMTLSSIPALLVAKLHEMVRKIGTSKRGIRVKSV
jgi:hypothetical protein